MQGISMDELYEVTGYCHETEFTYKGIPYILQPEVSNGKSWLVIWDLTEHGTCICRHEIPDEGDIPKETIEAVLSEPCFDGKSFLEIEQDITVTGTF